MDNNELFKRIFEINKATASDLFKMYCGNNNSNNPLTGLIFPKYQNVNGKNGLRISEQEARLHYCFNLDKKNFLYSIETPTNELYKFSGQKEMSARSDLSIYESLNEKVVNVEFKAHNPGQKSFDKDIQKIAREECCGNWFHLLKDIDNGTIKSLNEKFSTAIVKAFNLYPFNFNKKEKWVLFFIAILNKSKILYKKIEFNKVSEKNYINKQFSDRADWNTQI